MEQLLTTTTVLAALGSGLIAGAFFAFAAYVLPALSRVLTSAPYSSISLIASSLPRARAMVNAVAPSGALNFGSALAMRSFFNVTASPR